LTVEGEATTMPDEAPATLAPSGPMLSKIPRKECALWLAT